MENKVYQLATFAGGCFWCMEQKNPIVTKILPASTFYPAEEYHQRYHSKFPLRYSAYRQGSGRDALLKRHWNDRKRRKQ